MRVYQSVYDPADGWSATERDVRAVVGFKVFLIANVFVTRVRSRSFVYAGAQLVSDVRSADLFGAVF